MGLMLVAALSWFHQQAALKQQLIQDISDRAVDAYSAHTRQPHAPPSLDASFEDLIAPVLPVLQTAWRDSQSFPSAAQETYVEVRSGKRSPDELPEEYRLQIEKYREAVAIILRATHAVRLDIPRELDALRAESWQPDAGGWLPIQHAARLTALDIQQRVASNSPAVDQCLDGLALAREASSSHALLGSMLATAIVTIMTDACAKAIDAAPPEDQRRAAEGVRAIKSAMRSFEEAIDDEVLFADLGWASVILTADELDRLPPEAGAMARAQMFAELDQQFPLPRVLGWRLTMIEKQRINDALKRPRSERAGALTQAYQRHDACWNPLRNVPSSDFAPFYKRHERMHHRLDLLIALPGAKTFHRENHRWPTKAELGLGDVPVTASSDEKQLTLTISDDGYGAVSMSAAPDG
jgi:hypothetical protein